MAYDENLAARIRAVLAEQAGWTEKKMFGGTAFLVNGNMASGVHGDKLIVRLGVEAATSAMADPVVQPFDLSGRPMKGWITVGPEGCQTDEQLGDWIKQGLAYACSLPAK